MGTKRTGRQIPTGSACPHERAALGQNRVSVLHPPAQQQLRLAHPVFGRHLGEDTAIGLHLVGLGAVLSFLDTPSRERHEAAIGDRRDAVFSHVGDQAGLLRPGVQLDLVGVWHRQAGGADFLQVGLVEIADADGPRLARLVHLHQRPPLREALRPATGRVDQVEVDVVEAKERQAPVELGPGLGAVLGGLTPGRVAGPELGRHEDVGALEAGRREAGADAFAHRLFVAVARGRVDMPVAGPDRLFDYAGRILWRNEVGAEADGRNLGRGIQPEGLGHRGHGSLQWVCPVNPDLACPLARCLPHPPFCLSIPPNRSRKCCMYEGRVLPIGVGGARHEYPTSGRGCIGIILLEKG
jgi:hypothetical protein